MERSNGGKHIRVVFARHADGSEVRESAQARIEAARRQVEPVFGGIELNNPQKITRSDGPPNSKI